MKKKMTVKQKREAEQNAIAELERQLAESRASVAAWTQTAREYANNADFYREILEQIAGSLGPAVFVSDDGSVQDSPLMLKIPEAITALQTRIDELEAAQRWIPVSERLPDFDQYVEVFSNGVVQDHKWFIDMGSEDQWANDLVEYRERPDIQDSDMWRAIEPPEAPNE
ncbi:MAG: hypothetical protein KDI55_24105 [Anaerolineae bacterium]|nr:hypothetical protein [Anaerolineae bacterium]